MYWPVGALFYVLPLNDNADDDDDDWKLLWNTSVASNV